MKVAKHTDVTPTSDDWVLERYDDEIDLKRVDEANELRNKIPGQNLSAGWPPGFFDRTFGCFRDDPIERPEELPLEAREPLN